MNLETNRIREVAPGVHSVTLWCLQASIFGQLTFPEAPFVLSWRHHIGHHRWEPFVLPLIDPVQAVAVKARVASFDFVLPTSEFLERRLHLLGALRAVQLRRFPPDYLDLSKIHGKQRYRVLAESGWHLLIDTPGNDFGTLSSPDRNVLERALALHEHPAKG